MSIEVSASLESQRIIGNPIYPVNAPQGLKEAHSLLFMVPDAGGVAISEHDVPWMSSVLPQLLIFLLCRPKLTFFRLGMALCNSFEILFYHVDVI